MGEPFLALRILAILVIAVFIALRLQAEDLL